MERAFVGESKFASELNELYEEEKMAGALGSRGLYRPEKQARQAKQNAKINESGKGKSDAWKSYISKAAYAASSLLAGGLGYTAGATSSLVMDVYKGMYNFPSLNPVEILSHANYNGGVAAAVGLVAGPIIFKCLKSSTFSFFGWIYNGIVSIFKK